MTATETTRTSAGHMIVRQLEREGVQRVYGVPGESYLDVLDGLHDSPIKTIVTRHEGGAGFMALAEGRLTGNAGVAMVTRGPGAANAYIAVHTAWQDATPLVLLVGLIPVADRGREAFQEFDITGWFGSTAKWVTTLDDPSNAAGVIAKAMHIARSGRPGPVIVGLPEDLIREAADPETIAPTPDRASAGSAADLADLEQRLAEAEHPLVIVGGDGWHGPAGAQVSAWAAARGVPVAADWRAHDAVPHDHEGEGFVGILGYNHPAYLGRLFDEADLHVFIGVPRLDVLSDGYTIGQQTPAIVVTPGEPFGHAGRLDTHIPADIVTFAAAVSAAVPGVQPTDARVQRVREARAAFCEYRHCAPGNPATGVDVNSVMITLRERLDDDAVLTFGAGNHTLWPMRYLSHNSPNSLVAPRNGAMGVGVPAAVAAALVFPGRQVVSIAGDGCFMMNGQEIATAIAYGAEPITIVIDNGIFATIVEHQEHWYPGRRSGTDLVNPDFASFCRSFGGFGERVESTDEFEGALGRAIESGLPAVLHVVQDPAVRSPKEDGND
ncbi:thiamine pyrophosphate-dependent enzyme [Agrococcus casei]|uniref:Acetolactate synthase large subunit n=4 Tax=Agrococcus TaxID=46352 RepID=A0A1R4G061_9MICO|nr:thiamine pyrophosphate-dependent enzyme [Agrococcus casei]SJM61566.1 Acetolactate synthase large subunit [Agrococcus casei LMG 22410]